MAFFTEYISPIFLAILQGIAEFLPISSSGHLILLNSLMTVDLGLVFDLILHFATLISVVLFYRREIGGICMGCVREMCGSAEKAHLKFVGWLIVSTLITGVLGLCLNDIVEQELRNVVTVGALLILNAGILWVSQKRGVLKLSTGKLNFKTSLILGFVQGLAVLPGISRSGTTITAGLLMGINPADCAKISFLLSIPVILGACLLHIKDLSGAAVENLAVYGIAAAIAAAVGYMSLVFLTRVLKNAHFHRFAPYCAAVGALSIVCGLIF